MRPRLDERLLSLGLCHDLHEARGRVMSGQVLVDDRPVVKAGTRPPTGASIRLRDERGHPWVSRGGVKLEHAIRSWEIPVDGRVCLDIGASTGGFTEVLLSHGARQVHAVDVGYGLLAWKLRRDPRVVIHDRVNVRHVGAGFLPEPATLATLDVSFISLALALPPILPLLHPGSPGIALVKPQFEADRDEVGPGGVIDSESTLERVLRRVTSMVQGLGLEIRPLLPSPIPGPAGNREYLLHFRKPDGP
ncbi:MAG: TlyA family RNA methyltransferase [Magnetococcales bacterium]|nr:TlyA family RNA methyltransferase [Magnetococcales bacterium]